MLEFLLAVVMRSNIQSSEPTAERVIGKMVTKVRSSVPLSGSLTVIGSLDGVTSYRFAAMRPNLLKLFSLTERRHGGIVMPAAPIEGVYFCGEKVYEYAPAAHVFASGPSEASVNPAELVLIGYEQAFSDAYLYRNPKLPRLVSYRGAKAYALDFDGLNRFGPAKTTIFISAASSLPLGYEQVTKSTVTRAYYGLVRIKTSLRRTFFRWKRPAGAREITWKRYIQRGCVHPPTR